MPSSPCDRQRKRYAIQPRCPAVSYPFGPAKQWTVKATGFDLLQQLPDVQRTVNAQGRSEVRINTQPAYALLTLTYRLDIKPRK